MTYEFQATVSDGVISIPVEYRSKIANKVRVILVSEEEPESRLPSFTEEEINEMLKDSIVQSLIGALPDSGMTLDEYREERLSKYL